MNSLDPKHQTVIRDAATEVQPLWRKLVADTGRGGERGGGGGEGERGGEEGGGRREGERRGRGGREERGEEGGGEEGTDDNIKYCEQKGIKINQTDFAAFERAMQPVLYGIPG